VLDGAVVHDVSYINHGGGTGTNVKSKQIDTRHVLFISGYDQEALVAGDVSFLQKPFGRDELTRTVRALFDGTDVPVGSFAA
jgi:hypothetical protein